MERAKDKGKKTVLRHVVPPEPPEPPRYLGSAVGTRWSSVLYLAIFPTVRWQEVVAKALMPSRDVLLRHPLKASLVGAPQNKKELPSHQHPLPPFPDAHRESPHSSLSVTALSSEPPGFGI